MADDTFLGRTTMRTMITPTISAIVMGAVALFWLGDARSAGFGLITKPSNYSVQETAQRFEDGVRSKGWIVFTEIDHAAAAKAVDLEMKPRTVIIFGNPKVGTAPMQKFATLAIDNPPKALVWQDDQGKVWLTYNSGEYLGSTIYPRHGLSMPAEAIKSLEQLLTGISNQATQ